MARLNYWGFFAFKTRWMSFYGENCWDFVILIKCFWKRFFWLKNQCPEGSSITIYDSLVLLAFHPHLIKWAIITHHPEDTKISMGGPSPPHLRNTIPVNDTIKVYCNFNFQWNRIQFSGSSSLNVHKKVNWAKYEIFLCYLNKLFWYFSLFYSRLHWQSQSNFN